MEFFDKGFRGGTSLAFIRLVNKPLVSSTIRYVLGPRKAKNGNYLAQMFLNYTPDATLRT